MIERGTSRKWFYGVAALLLAGLALPVSAAIPGEQSVAVPLVMSIEGSPVRTSACIPLIEKRYDPAAGNWAEFRRSAKRMPEIALVRTLDAIVHRNKSAFTAITHPALGRDPVEMPRQADIFMQQFENVQVTEVKSYLKFDNYLVFVVGLEFDNRVMYSDFSYALDEHGDYRFLPYRSSDLGFRSVMAWVQSDWGWAGMAGGTPQYCSEKEVASAGYRIPFDEADKYNRLAPGLLLTGGTLGVSGMPDMRYVRLGQLIDQLKLQLGGGNFHDYVSGMTARGSNRIGTWLASASDEDRQQYIDSIVGQKPFFVLDANPFYVVYVDTQGHGVQSMYFLKEGGDGYKWANASYATQLDGIFKQEMVTRSAAQPAPFQDWKI